ncbi:MAG: hypothetical protein CM1200mP28_12780 [Deltaproteobacteria bacterium]|nr:MAG: hypothetical protein CM1200mP28_12780 [Deltaproteobacteria bacterium]
MNLRKTIFISINVSLCVIQLFTFNQSFAEEIVYSHAIVSTSTGEEIPVEVADTLKKRRLGLGKRTSLKKGWGMLFIFGKRKPYRFWMKDMQFPLDIIWLDNHRIVHIIHNAKPVNSRDEPEIMTSPVPVNFVLEIAAGRAAKLRLKTGQRMKFKF